MPQSAPFLLVLQEPDCGRRIVRVPFAPCSIGTGDDADVRVAAEKDVHLVIRWEDGEFNLSKFDRANPEQGPREARLRHGIHLHVAGLRMRFLDHLPYKAQQEADRIGIEVAEPKHGQAVCELETLKAHPARLEEDREPECKPVLAPECEPVPEPECEPVPEPERELVPEPECDLVPGPDPAPVTPLAEIPPPPIRQALELPPRRVDRVPPPWTPRVDGKHYLRSLDRLLERVRAHGEELQSSAN